MSYRINIEGIEYHWDSWYLFSGIAKERVAFIKRIGYDALAVAEQHGYAVYWRRL